jgi:PGF-CTERM protein
MTLNSDGNTLTVKLESEDVSVDLASTDEWENDGTATLNTDTAGAATGTYTIELDDGENTVAEDVEVVEQISTPTATPTPTEMETGSPTPTEGGEPGFGAVVAPVALLAAALLATRRDN